MACVAGARQQMPPEDKQKTAMKVIVTGESEKVVGIHIIGMGADEMMQGFGVAMKVSSGVHYTARGLKAFSFSNMYRTVLIVLYYYHFLFFSRCIGAVLRTIEIPLYVLPVFLVKK